MNKKIKESKEEATFGIYFGLIIVTFIVTNILNLYIKPYC